MNRERINFPLHLETIDGYTEFKKEYKVKNVNQLLIYDERERTLTFKFIFEFEYTITDEFEQKHIKQEVFESSHRMYCNHTHIYRNELITYENVFNECLNNLINSPEFEYYIIEREVNLNSNKTFEKKKRKM